MNETIISADSQELQDMNMAKDIGDTLHAHYPGWIWAVSVRSGVAIIKCLNLSSKWGFILHYNDIKGDAKVRKQETIRAGGELLERANVRRGIYQDGWKPTLLEGVKKYKPIGAY